MPQLVRQIVDDNDQVIDFKTRDEFDFSKDTYRVAVLWITNSKKEVLLAQRKKGKDIGSGQWGPAVAGTVEKGETYETNIYKEAKEEIGLAGENFGLGPKQRILRPRNYFVQWYTLQLDRAASSFVLQEDEAEAVRWISKQELIKDLKNHPIKYLEEFPYILNELV